MERWLDAWRGGWRNRGVDGEMFGWVDGWSR